MNRAHQLLQLTQHKFTVRAMLDIGSGHFVCAGRDVCVWNSDGKLKSQLSHFDEDSSIHSIIQISNSRIVAASDVTKLAIYNIVTRQEGAVAISLQRVIDGHREAVRELLNLSDR